MKVTIAPDFRDLLPRHSADELRQLEAGVLEDPKHERFPPVIVWANHKNTIVDGHNQYRFRTKHGLTIKYAKVEFETRDEALLYSFRVQAGRRNCSVTALAMSASKLPKNSRGGDRKSDQSASLHLDRGKIAEERGISERTLKYADKVREQGAAPVVKAAESGVIAVSDAAAVADLPKQEQAAALKKVTKGQAKTLREAVKEDDQVAMEDQVGNSVPDKLIPMFEVGNEFEQQARELTKVQQWAKKLDGKEVAAFLHVQSLVADLENAKRALRFAAPYAVCPYCSAKKSKCEACHGGGFVSKAVYNAAPQEMRA